MSTQSKLGLGTQLRLLLSLLDGELTDYYEQHGYRFRPRFYPVFQLLMHHQQASVSDIAEHLQVSQPAATQTLAEMKRNDFLVLKEGRDRRERIASLSTHGLEVAKELQPIWSAVACAASKLDQELSHPLSAILAEALSALARSSFTDRIDSIRRSQGE